MAWYQSMGIRFDPRHVPAMRHLRLALTFNFRRLSIVGPLLVCYSALSLGFSQLFMGKAGVLQPACLCSPAQKAAGTCCCTARQGSSHGCCGETMAAECESCQEQTSETCCHSSPPRPGCDESGQTPVILPCSCLADFFPSVVSLPPAVVFKHLDWQHEEVVELYGSVPSVPSPIRNIEPPTPPPRRMIG
jgi:hypothetical protein